MFGNRFGSRLNVIVGGILQAVGAGLAAFAPSVILIHLTLGLLTGKLFETKIHIEKFYHLKHFHLCRNWICILLSTDVG